jgi:tRNA/tmRNA/rRNA uracil-C5-methylase (TrmA/RlmC/RlmD family)
LSVSKKKSTRAQQGGPTAASKNRRPSQGKRKASPETLSGRKSRQPGAASAAERGFSGSRKPRSEKFEEETFGISSRPTARTPGGKRKSTQERPFAKKTRGPAAASHAERGFTGSRKPRPERFEEETFRPPSTATGRPSQGKNKSTPEKPLARKTRRPGAASAAGRGFPGSRKPRPEQTEEDTFRSPASASERPSSRKKTSPPKKTFGPKTRRTGAASPAEHGFAGAGTAQPEQSEEELFWAPASATDRSFASFLKPLIPKTIDPEGQAILYSSPLAHLDYSVELQIKDQGLMAFWKQHRLPGLPEQVIRSPKARGYRTTSKRKAFLHGSTLYLLLGDKAALPKNRQYFTASPLEPKEHEVIYRFLQQKLSEPAFRLIAGHLNYLIIRGGYTEQAVIFNVDLLNGPLVRKMKLLSAHLQKLPVAVSAAFVYLDPSQSDYYLETKRPAETLHFKKLFGPDQLGATYLGCRYQFHPTSFSQINESMVETMLARARELLAPAPDQALLDLYCGYGLFSHYLAPAYRQVLAVDGEGPSIRAAEANSRLNQNRGGQTKFLAHRITVGYLEKTLPPPAPGEVILLDPPRQGTLPGVIAALARRQPKKVLQIFCGVDQIPPSLREWQASGYKVRRVAPLDMFPGSANLEILVLLEPKA